MRAALAFLTTLGRRGGPPLSAGALAWFGAIGAGLGLLLGGWWWVTERWWAPVIAAVLVVAADAALTGALHLDGLTDTADGVLPHATRDERLSIMRAPDVGAFGVVTVVVVIVAQVGALAALDPEPLLLAALWGATRAVVAAVPARVPPARDDGIGRLVAAGATPAPALAVLPALALGAVALGWSGLLAVAGAVLAAEGVVALARHRIGGYTGDVLGAAIVMGQTAGLVLASARW
jgi:adenosylcobinamide-GDP ribazoletransferase